VAEAISPGIDTKLRIGRNVLIRRHSLQYRGTRKRLLERRFDDDRHPACSSERPAHLDLRGDRMASPSPEILGMIWNVAANGE
jgi:hypothetical protein